MLSRRKSATANYQELDSDEAGWSTYAGAAVNAGRNKMRRGFDDNRKRELSQPGRGRGGHGVIERLAVYTGGAMAAVFEQVVVERMRDRQALRKQQGQQQGPADQGHVAHDRE